MTKRLLKGPPLQLVDCLFAIYYWFLFLPFWVRQSLLDLIEQLVILERNEEFLFCTGLFGLKSNYLKEAMSLSISFPFSSVTPGITFNLQSKISVLIFFISANLALFVYLMPLFLIAVYDWFLFFFSGWFGKTWTRTSSCWSWKSCRTSPSMMKWFSYGKLFKLFC